MSWRLGLSPVSVRVVSRQIIVTVQLVEIGCNLPTLDIVPGTLTDAITEWTRGESSVAAALS
jgi:hypothetical protein